MLTCHSVSLSLFFLSFFFVELEFNLCLLGRCYTTWVMPPALFSVVIFEIGFCFIPQAGLDHDPPVYVSRKFWNNREYHYTQHCLLRWGFLNFLPELSWKQNLPNFSLLCSWDDNCAISAWLGLPFLKRTLMVKSKAHNKVPKLCKILTSANLYTCLICGHILIN
jgi:hypothetical protein